MSTIKEKTLKGFVWSFVETFSSQIIGFIATIILARILFPSDFGLIGMTAVFTTLSQVLVDSGFSQALIRKQNCSNKDYSTVFFINIFVSLVLYLILYLSAPLIADFFNQNVLVDIIRVISISIVINSFGIIQRVILTKKVDFRTQAIVSLFGSLAGFGISIYMAYNGYGVWSLVVRGVASQFFMIVLLWVLNNWRPALVFSLDSFKELFGFGSKLLFVYSFSILFKNINNAIIGKIYNPTVLGYYTNADQMTGLPSGTLTTLYNKVAYPVLSQFQNDDEQLKVYIKKISVPLMMLTFTFMIFLITIADSFIPLLFGYKWIESIPYFKILCVAYMAPIMHSSNQIIMNIKGRSDYFLRTEIVKYLFFIPVVIIGYYYGIYILLIGFTAHYWLGFIINAFYSKRLINYGIFEQIKDMILPMLFGLVVGFSSFLVKQFINIESSFIIVLQVVVALVIGVLLLRFMLLSYYLELKSLLFKFILNRKTI